MKRWIVVCAMSACLMFTPTQSHAQVAEILLKCTKSLGVAVACMVIQGGVSKVIDISWGKLIELAFGREEIDPKDFPTSKVSAADIEANGIEWPKLKEFLISLFGSNAQVEDAEARVTVAESCRKNYHPVCPHLGILAPRAQFQDLCSKITTQEACDTTAPCSWKGSSCLNRGGLKEYFDDMKRAAPNRTLDKR